MELALQPRMINADMKFQLAKDEGGDPRERTRFSSCPHGPEGGRAENMIQDHCL
jgi:hypothetical protein